MNDLFNKSDYTMRKKLYSILESTSVIKHFLISLADLEIFCKFQGKSTCTFLLSIIILIYILKSIP